MKFSFFCGCFLFCCCFGLLFLVVLFDCFLFCFVVVLVCFVLCLVVFWLFVKVVCLDQLVFFSFPTSALLILNWYQSYRNFHRPSMLSEMCLTFFLPRCLRSRPTWSTIRSQNILRLEGMAMDRPQTNQGPGLVRSLKVDDGRTSLGNSEFFVTFFWDGE